MRLPLSLILTTAGSIATSLCLAGGNTLEAVLGAYLIIRFAQGRHVFERGKDIFKFAAFGGMIATAVSATVGVTSLCLGGFADWTKYQDIWLTWWLGDAVGIIVLAPALILWAAITTGFTKPGNGFSKPPPYWRA